ncbi:hypothetical protein SteCoe_24380 [Stentor coeruleus]|uniref:Uncharacterized protein n=1 Tax=Stentor coeruleus TaxID=5963 RepID=A0A1R2BHT8_9CILI|nr:hypothetical protein SteCoe_24380 [Stentor coeruleus]
MSSYDEEIVDKGYSNQDYSKSLILTDLAISKLESKLVVQRGSNTLNLSDSFIGDEGCGMVASFLKENMGINSLELRGNSITSEGLKLLANVFRGQNFIRNISLEWNNIGDGIGVLTESLLYSNSLQSLDLRNNRIGSDGASHLSRFIENSTSILRIDLRWNELGVLGAKKILSSVPRSRSIKTIELSGNKIPEDLILQIEQQLKGEDKYQKYEEKFLKPEEKFSRTEDKFQIPEGRASREDRLTPKSPSRSKEFSYSDELYAKYEAQMISNARSEARVNELEILLEQETRRVQEIRSDLLKDLDAEKARRSYAEENFMIFKEESLKREMEDGRTIQELEAKLNRMGNEKNMVIMELENLQEQYDKLHANSQERIRGLEERINQQERQGRQLEETNRQVLDRTKKEAEQNLYEISRDYQNKLEISEENFRVTKIAKEGLENEVRGLKNQISQIKTQAQEALNDQEYRIKEEETTKLNNTVRNFEARIKTLEESRENLNKRLSEVQKDFVASEKRADEQIASLEQALGVARDEKTELGGRLQKISAQKDNISNDLYVTKSALDRANQENEELNKNLKERKDAYMAQLEKICQEHSNERKSLENNQNILNDQLKQLENDFNKLRRDRDRIIKEHEYLAETLKQKVSLLIQETIMNHMRKLDSE